MRLSQALLWLSYGTRKISNDILTYTFISLSGSIVMKHKGNITFIPVERQETTRKEITTLLSERSCTAREISSAIKISEKEVYDNLEYILKTIHRDKRKLVITPCHCRKCGFVFKKRERMKKPGKCPLCRSESIEDARFFIQAN